jgi:hypothetical protein
VGEEAWHKAGFAASSSLYEDLDDPYSPEWMEGVLSEDLPHGVLGSPCQSPASIPDSPHLHTGVEALSTRRGMHVCGVAGQQDPSLAVGRGLASHIGEPADPGGTVHPIIRPVYGDERLAEIAQGGFAGRPEVLLGH